MNRCVTMLAGVLVCAATHATVAAGGQAPKAEIRSIKEFETLQIWSRAVWAHNPGEADASVRTIAAWRESDIAQVRADIWAIATLVSRGSNPGAMIRYTG